MNKNLWKCIILIIGIVLIVIYTLLRWPREIDKRHDGVEYLIGDVEQVKDINMHIKGVIEKDWKLNKTFIGSINISGINDLFNDEYSEEIQEALLNRTHEIPLLDETMWTPFYLYEVIDNRGYSQDIGCIYFSDNFEEIVLTIGGNIHMMFQNDLKGRILAAPASNREEAVKVTNYVTRRFTLENPTTEMPQELLNIIKDDPKAKEIIGDEYSVISSEAMSSELIEGRKTKGYKVILENSEVRYLVYLWISEDGNMREFSIYEKNRLSNEYEIVYEVSN